MDIPRAGDGLEIGDWRLGTGDWRLETGDWRLVGRDERVYGLNLSRRLSLSKPAWARSFIEEEPSPILISTGPLTRSGQAQSNGCARINWRAEGSAGAREQRLLSWNELHVEKEIPRRSLS
jgi:hypothetical protein